LEAGNAVGYWAWDWLSGRPEHVVIHGSVGLLAGSSSDRLELDMATAHFVIHPQKWRVYDPKYYQFDVGEFRSLLLSYEL